MPRSSKGIKPLRRAAARAGDPKAVELTFAQQHSVFKSALMLSLKRTRGDRTQLQRVADALVRKAVQGNIHAIKEIADRVDGKVASKMEVEDSNGNPIPTSFAVVFVKDGTAKPIIEGEAEDAGTDDND